MKMFHSTLFFECVGRHETVSLVNVVQENRLETSFKSDNVKALIKLEDLKVLRRSPDLLNNCKTGQGQLQLIMKHILFYHIWGLQPFWSSNLNNLTAQ